MLPDEDEDNDKDEGNDKPKDMQPDLHNRLV